MSQHARIPHAPASAGPSTAATTGAGQPSTASSIARQPRASSRFCSAVAATAARISSRSAPAENDGPSAARTTARASPASRRRPPSAPRDERSSVERTCAAPGGRASAPAPASAPVRSADRSSPLTLPVPRGDQRRGPRHRPPRHGPGARTNPARGAVSGISIFIASTTTSVARASTRSPGATSTRMTLPGIGAASSSDTSPLSSA